MSYQVLARKWRPRTFKDMIGQEYILRMLVNALQQKRIHHAYLFTGTRGVGKTTLARILAKCLNCEAEVTASPCGACHACVAIDKGQFLDLYEIDAASRTKVEDTRELLENVFYPPHQGRYKIYLIDEVHMLSNHSFNALLKTLEEPPEHVKFLLATTEPKRLPITILSRCLQFHLKQITPEQIAQHLKHICVSENVSAELKSLELIALKAEGSMRDALSLLDQAIAYGEGQVNEDDVRIMLGHLAESDLLPLLEALSAKSGAQLFNAILDLSAKAPDFQQVLAELISLFHNIAVAKAIPEAKSIEEQIVPFLHAFTPEDIQLYYQIALLGRRDLALAPSARQGFEMTMLRMLTLTPQLRSSEHTLEEGSQKNIETSLKHATGEIQKVQVTEVCEASLPWRELLPKLELSGMAYALAANCTLEDYSHHKIKLALSVHHEPMLNAKLKDRIQESLSRYLNHPVQLEINVTTSELITPVKQFEIDRDERLSKAKETIMQDPKIKQLIEMYDATVEVSLL